MNEFSCLDKLIFASLDWIDKLKLRGPNPNGGVTPYYIGLFPQGQHENEKNCTEEARVPVAPGTRQLI